MKLKQLIILVLISLFGLSSCVPIEEIAYLQTEKEDNDQVYELNYDDYVVGYNDILYISVKTEEDVYLKNPERMSATSSDAFFYLSGYTVDKEGYIDLPVVGEVYVFGLDVSEIKSRLNELLNSYYKKFVLVVKPTGVKVSILGEVRRPGSYTFYQNNVTIFDLLARSGDLGGMANRKRIKILRHTDDNVKIHYVDLTNQEIFNSDFYYLQPEDVFYIEPLPVKTWGIGSTGFSSLQTLISILSSAFLIVNVTNQ
ncbi:MAG: polysaccharide biosynthesis/export family protein [Flavobacteriales bacterium]